ncbi:MAG: GTP 3',8-cyclase MoaA [Flavobacteriaceae bacterium]
MKDVWGRELTYLRLAITDRCNLRCNYCMPAQGIELSPKRDLLSFEEYIKIVKNSVSLGVNKVRITGGEPLVRKDVLSFFRQLSQIEGLKSWNLTTNGVLLDRYLPDLEKLGIDSVNLSMDSLQEDRFQAITRRNDFKQVKSSLYALIDSPVRLKLNVVLMADQNTDEIKDFIELSRLHDLELRFIEEMPFNGGSLKASKTPWSAKDIVDEIYRLYPNVEELGRGVSETSFNYRLAGSKGSFGVIPAFTRSICNDCNRIRITAKGELKNCLYDKGVYDFKRILRDANLSSVEKDIMIREELNRLVKLKPKDGFEAAEAASTNSVGYRKSMSHIGG